MKAGWRGTQPMNVTVEHETTDGEIVTKTYEDVAAIVNPPPVTHTLLKREDGDVKVEGDIIRAE
jgi:hypothetical protein